MQSKIVNTVIDILWGQQMCVIELNRIGHFPSGVVRVRVRVRVRGSERGGVG